MISRGRLVVIAAFGGLGLGMLGLVYYSSLDDPLLEKVQLELVGVKVLETNSIDHRATVEVSFLVVNPTEKTFTVPNINYELFVNNKDVGNGQYSTEDVAMPGRAAIYGGDSVKLTSKFSLVYSDQIADEFSLIINGDPASYRAKGIISVESAWSIVEKPFEISLG